MRSRGISTKGIFAPFFRRFIAKYYVFYNVLKQKIKRRIVIAQRRVINYTFRFILRRGFFKMVKSRRLWGPVKDGKRVG